MRGRDRSALPLTRDAHAPYGGFVRTQRSVGFAYGLGLLALASLPSLFASGCGSERITAPPDTTAPRFQVLAPVDTLYDLDGDKLVDVSITWVDSGGAIDPASVRVRSLRPLNGPADTTTNLIGVWRVVRLDSAGLLLRETLDNLLPDGLNRLEIGVADTAGNRLTDTLIFVLPSGAVFGTIQTGVTSSTDHVTDLVLDSAGHRGYASASHTLVVFDPESLRVLATIASEGASHLQGIVLDERSQFAYASDGRIERFDLRTNTLVGRVPGTFATAALAFSRVNSGLLYAGESFAGWIGYVDVAANARVDEMQIPHLQDEYIFDLAVLAGDTKVYMTRYAQGGILVIDPQGKQLLRHIQYVGDTPFFASDFDLARDERRLYVALMDADPRGIAELDTETDSVVRVLPLDSYVPEGIELSPSERRLFVTTQDRFFPSKNVLVDVRTWRVIHEFDRPRDPASIRVDGPVAFRPDGKLVFVGRDLVIDVYLNRESSP